MIALLNVTFSCWRGSTWPPSAQPPRGAGVRCTTGGPARRTVCITGAGWLAAFPFVEAGLGRSLIHRDEGLGFLAVLVAGLVFEAAWYALNGTNAVASGPAAARAQRDPRA